MPGLTCGKVATGVRDRLLALVHGVRLHLIRAARCQLLGRKLQRLVAGQYVAAIVLAARWLSDAQYLDLEAGVVTRAGWLPCD